MGGGRRIAQSRYSTYHRQHLFWDRRCGDQHGLRCKTGTEQFTARTTANSREQNADRRYICTQNLRFPKGEGQWAARYAPNRRRRRSFCRDSRNVGQYGRPLSAGKSAASANPSCPAKYSTCRFAYKGQKTCRRGFAEIVGYTYRSRSKRQECFVYPTGQYTTAGTNIQTNPSKWNTQNFTAAWC